MAKSLLIAGTASHVGKSTVATGLCRLLRTAGLNVVPYKAQNMSNNARAVLSPDGEWGEIGISQYVQARAADVGPTTDNNPVLLKPRGAQESQLIIHGQAVGHVSSESYFDSYWERAKTAAIESYDRLSTTADVIIAEGAGSIAEINLHHRDLANVETTRFADAEILLLGDIERGGVFASLYGTIKLVPEDIRDRITGICITKFRGDQSVLQSGIDTFESLTDIPIVGVLPYQNLSLPSEDSLSLPPVTDSQSRTQKKANDQLTIGVIRLPHVSNFTDIEPLTRYENVQVRYLPIDSGIDGVDAIVVPGTKNTVDDLAALRETGMAEGLYSFNGPIVGICGGYQLLGEQLHAIEFESPTKTGSMKGVGLLPVETTFTSEKEVRSVEVPITGEVGLLSGAFGKATGYEIHMGETTVLSPLDQPLGENSAATKTVLGTYLHGLFENIPIRNAFLESVAKASNSSAKIRTVNSIAQKRDPYAQAMDLVRSIDRTWLANTFDLEDAQ